MLQMQVANVLKEKRQRVQQKRATQPSVYPFLGYGYGIHFHVYLNIYQ